MRGAILILVAGCGLVTACAKPARNVVPAPPPPAPVVRTKPVVAPIPIRKPAIPAVTVARCPSLAEIRRLRAARPKPLRGRPMPASPAERVARTSAQLGLYEARGAWADQVEDALSRCDPS